MTRKYYVIGFADTRQEFYPKGVTTSKKKALEFKKVLFETLHTNSRQWVEIKEVNGI